MSEGLSLLGNVFFLPLWVFVVAWWRWLASRWRTTGRHNFPLLKKLYREAEYRQALQPLLEVYWEERQRLYEKAVKLNPLPEWTGTFPDKDLVLANFKNINETVDLLGGSVESFLQRPLARLAPELARMEQVFRGAEEVGFWTSLARQLHLYIAAATVTSLAIGVIGLVVLTLSESGAVPTWAEAGFIAIPYAGAVSVLGALLVSELGLHKVGYLVAELGEVSEGGRAM